ncbi:hypothetical protein N0V84_006452 [Fusarium piperis]|uniref:Uncharacterized protein n=1 Tax=Fusarium piperis TaxID=1435070 RepID=A0A9W8WBV9_9HYPO|nr:hypothetical protein N0V84_006452 [Fusarium piperis]
MKFYVAIAISFLSGAQAAESASTTVTCSGCPPHSSTPDMVTRSALPTISCTEKPLSIITDESWSSSLSSGVSAPTGSMPASTPSPVVPVNGASSNNMGTMGVVLVIAAVAAGCMI